MAGFDKLAAPPSEPDDAETIVAGLMRQRIAEKQTERAKWMSVDERMQAIRKPDRQEKHLAQAHKALAEVKAELRERLSGELDPNSGTA